MGVTEIRPHANMLSLVMISVMACATQAFLLDSLSGLTSQEKWDGLKTTWGANPFSSEYFVTFPRTAQDAINEGFHKISDCDTTANGEATDTSKVQTMLSSCCLMSTATLLAYKLRLQTTSLTDTPSLSDVHHLSKMETE